MKKGVLKLLVFPISFLILLGISGLLVGKWYTDQTNQKIDKLVQIQARELENSFSNLHIKNINVLKEKRTFLLTPYQKGNALNSKMLTLNRLWPKKNNSAQGSFLTILKPEIKDTALRGVRQINLHRITYQRNFLSITFQEDEIVHQYHVKNDDSEFTVNDLFPGHSERLREDILQLVKETQKKSKTKHKTNRNINVEMDRLLYKANGMYLGNGFFLSYDRYFDIIDETYLKGEILAAYKTWKSEQEQTLLDTETETEPLNSEKKRVALTFDDGPSASTTSQVLDILSTYKSKATFYVLGRSISGNESILKRISQEGHEIGNHTWSHTDLTQLGIEEITQELNATNDSIQKVTGVIPQTFRPPYGATNNRVQSSTSMQQILWTVDTKDWQIKTTESILQHVQEETGEEGIVLMHDIHPTTVRALPKVIEFLYSEGYELVTISELLHKS